VRGFPSAICRSLERAPQTGIGYASLSPNMDTSKFLDWIKLSPRYLTPFAVVSGFLLFAKEKWLEVLGLAEFVPKYRPYIGVILLLSVGLLASHLLNSLFGWISQRRKLSRKLKNGMKHLQTLTIEEKEILKAYIETGTRTQYLPMRSGVVSGLEWDMILIRSSNIGDLEEWSYNIQPWVWDYLHKHPDLLRD
jgi:hypothetical protein